MIFIVTSKVTASLTNSCTRTHFATLICVVAALHHTQMLSTKWAGELGVMPLVGTEEAPFDER